MDFDAAGHPVGLEILTLAANVDVDGLVSRYNIPEIRDALCTALDERNLS